MTAQLLAFSRSQKLELKPVAIGPVFERLAPLLEGALGKAVTIDLKAPRSALTVIGDATQLELAVLNLAINARDAMPNGGAVAVRAVPLKIIDDPELPAGSYVAVSVKDNGVGMPEDVRRRAFDPFFTTKGVGKGTGLGLAQVYGIARQAGGDARVESCPGEGTIVTLILPQVAESRRRGAGAVASDASPISANVLVIDDDEGVRAYVAEALEAAGYAVRAAENGHAGLKAIEADCPDLMIVDFAMPGLNGADVAKQALASCPGIAVLFASGYAESAALEAAMGEATVLLRKPFDTATLLAAVQSALANRRAAVKA